MRKPESSGSAYENRYKEHDGTLNNTSFEVRRTEKEIEKDKRIPEMVPIDIQIGSEIFPAMSAPANVEQSRQDNIDLRLIWSDEWPTRSDIPDDYRLIKILSAPTGEKTEPTHLYDAYIKKDRFADLQRIFMQ